MESSVNLEITEVTARSLGQRKRKLFSRDLNYLRDVALFWPFIFYSTFCVASVFSPGYRHLAIRCGFVAIAALLLAKEKLLLFVVGAGFVAIQCAITLALHSWNSAVFATGILTSGIFLGVGWLYRQHKLTYEVPDEFRLVDALWSVVAIVCSLLLAYLVSPFD